MLLPWTATAIIARHWLVAEEAPNCAKRSLRSPFAMVAELSVMSEGAFVSIKLVEERAESTTSDGDKATLS